MNQSISKQLQSLGFSEYEVRAYVVLLQKGNLTGYQLAQASNIPRPSIYPVLKRLEERGAVVRFEEDETVHYRALPADQMLADLSRQFETNVRKAKESLESLQFTLPESFAWNLKGYDAILHKAETLIGESHERLLVGCWAEEAKHLATALASAKTRQLEPTMLCIQGCAQECGHCCGKVYRYPWGGPGASRWLVVIGDNKSLLVAQLFPDGQAIGAFSTLDALVSMGTHYLLNAAAVAEVVRSLGPQLLSLLDGPAKEALQGAGLALNGQSWWERVSNVVQKRGTNT